MRSSRETVEQYLRAFYAGDLDVAAHTRPANHSGIGGMLSTTSSAKAYLLHCGSLDCSASCPKAYSGEFGASLEIR